MWTLVPSGPALGEIDTISGDGDCALKGPNESSAAKIVARLIRLQRWLGKTRSYAKGNFSSVTGVTRDCGSRRARTPVLHCFCRMLCPLVAAFDRRSYIGGHTEKKRGNPI